jgi:hypothetical protein
MQESDVGFRINHHLTVKLQYQPQRRVRRGVLRAEIQGPKTFSLIGIRSRRIDQFQWHLT